MFYWRKGRGVYAGNKVIICTINDHKPKQEVQGPHRLPDQCILTKLHEFATSRKLYNVFYTIRWHVYICQKLTYKHVPSRDFFSCVLNYIVKFAILRKKQNNADPCMFKWNLPLQCPSDIFLIQYPIWTQRRSFCWFWVVSHNNQYISSSSADFRKKDYISRILQIMHAVDKNVC